MKKIFVIILHFGNLQTTIACLQSFTKNEKEYAQIVLVNNDKSILTSKDLVFKKLHIINNGKNLGFAGGVNKGLLYALERNADAVLLLNNDVLIGKPFIQHLIGVFTKYPKVGIVGPAICFKKDNIDIFDVGGFVNLSTGRTRHKEIKKINDKAITFPDYITGAAMLIKKEVFEKIGLFNEDFFLYYEDADFCLRARNAGLQIAVNPEVIVYHLLSKTIGKVNGFAIYHQTRSLIIFGKKYIHSPMKKVMHLSFLLAQTILLSIKHPKASLSGWTAIMNGLL